MAVSGALSPAGRLTQQANRMSSQSKNRNINMQRTAGAASQMTYHSISAELEGENSALEDLHMFFVAFYKRQRKIIEKFEQG